MRAVACLIMALMTVISSSASAQPAEKWVTSWTGSVQGPYPIGNPSAQPDLRFAFPSTESGARDQSFRLIVRPDLWGGQVRLRFSNALGTKPVTFDGVYVGLQRSAATLVPVSNQPVSFVGRRETTVAPGLSVWSDSVTLPFVRDPAAPELLGRKLAVSFHIVGESGPMTWHAKALTTSYLTAPGAGAKGAAEDEQAFPFSTASWYFLDALDMMAPAEAHTIVAFGDSITDGTASTMNGDDRWPDVLARRLHAIWATRSPWLTLASAATRWWGRLNTRRKNRFLADHQPKTGSTAMCCYCRASRRSSGSKASTILARTAMPQSKRSRWA
jgi:hypothetical protein